ncbi:hypothetical protein C8R48DRAFT_735253 [Suillus tomentosus]|nr:hypothetical protein C8R48DRAFT_735253 [Suillus tomentosus]
MHHESLSLCLMVLIAPYPLYFSHFYFHKYDFTIRMSPVQMSDAHFSRVLRISATVLSTIWASTHFLRYIQIYDGSRMGLSLGLSSQTRCFHFPVPQNLCIAPHMSSPDG